MPLGLIRLNERRHRANANISFIKTLDTPDAEIALDILERVAAIVWPVMRDNSLGVMSLEEFPPNREFWGRNFEAGECIQLVLKSPSNGHWLPFPFVCRVMIHELAHIKQMNHSRAFHAVRIKFTKELDGLIARGYSGEGFWSQGQTLSAELTAHRELSDAELPENLCGGGYRKARKTGAKRKLNYQERQQQRKERLFGRGEGESLGTDVDARVALEKVKGKGKVASTVKPRVAQSKRGRDLRLEAAMKRLEQNQASTSNGKGKAKKEETEDDESDQDEQEEYVEEYEPKAVDVGDGRQGVKVEEEDSQDEEEWDDLKMLCATNGHARLDTHAASRSSAHSKNEDEDTETEAEQSDSEAAAGPTSRKKPLAARKQQSSTPPTPPQPSDSSSRKASRRSSTPPTPPAPSPPRRTRVIKREQSSDLPVPLKNTSTRISRDSTPEETKPIRTTTTKVAATSAPSGTCQVCTADNDPSNILCFVCANVLDTVRTKSWKCASASCRDSPYSNPLDAGVCGICGARRAS